MRIDQKISIRVHNYCIYVNDLNIIGTPREIEQDAQYLTKEFEMNDLGKINFCLDLQIEHLKMEYLFINQTTNKRVVKWFYMDKVHPINNTMIIWSLNVKDDPFWPQEEDEEILRLEAIYISSLCTLAYSVNLFDKYNNSPNLRHWKGVRHLPWHLRGKQDLVLFYEPTTDDTLFGCANAGIYQIPIIQIAKWIYIYICMHNNILEIN